MRVLFVCCFVVCAAAVMTGAATDGVAVVPVAARLTDDSAVRPQTVLLGAAPSAAPEPTDTPEPTPSTTVAPVAPVVHAVSTPTPTPKPTMEPTPKPTPKPAPKPTPASTVTPSHETPDQVRSEIRSAWGGDDNKAIGVANCESGLNPQASSPSGTNLGLWQFTMATYHQYGGSGDPRNASAYTQTQVAWNLYQQQGWSPWSGCAG